MTKRKPRELVLNIKMIDGVLWDRRMTWADLARAMGKTGGNVTNIKARPTRVTFATVNRIGNALGLDPYGLVSSRIAPDPTSGQTGE